jgi:cytidylate kinase
VRSSIAARKEVSRMARSVTLDNYLRYVETQMRPSRAPGSAGSHERRPAVTISRQAGAGSHVVAEELISRLGGGSAGPWTIVDRDLVAQVLEDHHLPATLARFMPEDRVSETADTLDQLFGLRPSAWTLVRNTAGTILRLAEIGNVVLIGRGANMITRNLDLAFHVRLVGSLPVRVQHVMEYKHLGEHDAQEYVRSEDLKRERYVRKYYDVDIEDPLNYDLVVNTDRVSYGETAELIAGAVRTMVTRDAAATTRTRVAAR